MSAMEVEPEPTLPPIVALVSELATSRNVPPALLFGALEESLTAGYAAETGSDSCTVRIDSETGDLEVFERRHVVDTVTDPLREIALKDAPRGYLIGDFLDRPVPIGDFARHAALTAKRVILQRVLEFERERTYAHFKAMEGTLVTGLVQREIGGAVYVLVDDRNEACMPPWEKNPRESYPINAMLPFEVQAVKRTRKGPAVLLSRGSERFVRLLMDSRSIVRAARVPGRLTALLVTRPIDGGKLRDVRQQIGGERIEQYDFSNDPRAIIDQMLRCDDYRLVYRPEVNVFLAVSGSPWVWDRAPLAAQLAGETIVPCKPDELDATIADLEAQAQVTAEIPEPNHVVDPDLVAKLEAFARERAAAAAEEEQDE